MVSLIRHRWPGLDGFHSNQSHRSFQKAMISCLPRILSHVSQRMRHDQNPGNWRLVRAWFWVDRFNTRFRCRLTRRVSVSLASLGSSVKGSGPPQFRTQRSEVFMGLGSLTPFLEYMLQHFGSGSLNFNFLESRGFSIGPTKGKLSAVGSTATK